MRIFIGIKLAGRANANVQQFLEPFQKIASPIRWVKPQNIHLTLKFIGEVTDDTYKKIETALSAPAVVTDPDTGSFDVTLSGCGRFGKGTTLSIFWIGAGPIEPLETLFNQIENRLARIGIPKEDRPFKPHITVGRNKRNFNFRHFFQLIDRYKDQHISRFPVSQFQLFKSTLTPDGPIYSILKEIPLNHAQA